MKRRRAGKYTVLIAAALLLIILSAGTTPAETNEQTAFRYFTETMELPPAAACGIMANIYLESGFVPDITGYGGAYGICQWMGVRTSRLQSYCSSNGLDYRSMKGQLSFLNYELQIWFPSVLSYMRQVPNTADGAYKAGYHWCYYFEIPGNREATSATRGNSARSVFWPKYSAKMLQISVKNARYGLKVLTKNAGDYGFRVYRSDSASGTFKKIGTAAAGKAEYLDKTAEVGRTYYYYVVPLNKKGKAGTASGKASLMRRGSVRNKACDISLAKSSVLYTGKKRYSKVTVIWGGKKLVKNTDYKLTWKNNLHAGTATVRITGIGNYYGWKELTYKIRKRAQVITAHWHKVKFVRNKVYNLKVSTDGGGALTFTSSAPKVVRVVNNKLVIKGTGIAWITIRAGATGDYKKAEKKIRLRVVEE